MLTDNVIREFIVFRDPVPHSRKAIAERHVYDIVRPSDEDRTVSNVRVAFDMLNHFSVVVRCEIGLMSAILSKWNPADEICQPGDLRFFHFRVLVPIVVDVPGFVGNHEIIFLLFEHLLKHHEILDKDFVHAPDRLKSVEIVLAGFIFDMRTLIGEDRAGRVNSLFVSV